MITIMTSVKWYLMMVLFYRSLIISDFEHIFMYLFSVCMSSLKKCLFKSSAHFFIVFFLILSCMRYLYILEVNLLSVASFANTFSHSQCCLFILFMVSFAVQKRLGLVRPHLFIFVFIFITLGGRVKRSCCNLCQTEFCLFSSKRL